MDSYCDLCSSATFAHICDTCADKFAADLSDLAGWLAEEVDTTLGGLKAIRPSGMPGGGGSEDVGLRVDWRAAEVRRDLAKALARAVTHCLAEQTPNSSPRETEPYGPVPVMAEWLGWRVDGLTKDPDAHVYVKPILSATFTARRSVDRPLDREYLGTCLDCDRGHLYALGEADVARCDVCGFEYDRPSLSLYVVERLDDQLVTAAEAARLALHLGLKAGRPQVANRIRTWVTRGALLPEVPFTRHYRFGPIWRLLTRQDAGMAGLALDQDTPETA